MPINTPETDQAIASQEVAKQGDFSAARLPSPGALPYPTAPPIAINGTGDTREQTTDGRISQGNDTVAGGNVDTNFMNKVLGVKDTPYSVGKLPTYTAQQVNNQRYSTFLPGSDNEERAARGQSLSDKWGNAFVKFAATTIGTFYNGMIAIPSAIQAATTKGSDTYNSFGANAVDTWKDSFENKFPNYYTKWEQDHPFISAIPFVGTGGFANFWGDKMLKNFGFTVGAIASAAVTDMAVGAVTGGIGDIPLIGNQVGKAALYLNKIFGAGKVAELGEGINASEQSIFAASNLKRVSGLSKLGDGTRYAINSYAAAASEAGFEARDGYNTTRQDLITAYQNEKGYNPMGKDLEDIESSATAGANVRFMANLVLLGVSNSIQFDNLLKPWNIAKTGVRSTIEREAEGIGKIGLVEGSIDKFEPKIQGKLARFANFSRPYIADILAEGFYEEGGQYGVQVGTQNYYERKYLAEHKLDKSGYSQDTTEFDSHNPVNEILHSTLEGMKAEFGTQEGAENIFLGALTGIVSKGLKAGWDRFRGNGEDHGADRDKIIGFLNRDGVTGTITNLYDNTVETHRIASDMKAAVKTGDLFKYKNYQHEMFSKFVTSGLQAGRFDVRMEQLDLLKDMPNDKFKEAFGMEKSDVDTKTVGQYVDLMKEQAQNIKKTYDLINDTFGNPFVKTNNKRLNAEQAVENANHETFENLKGDLTYLASIQGDVRDRQKSITNDIKKIDPRVNLETLRTLTNPIALKEYTKTLTQQRDDILKASEEPTSPTKKEDAKEAADLTKKIDLINSALATPSDGKLHEQMFSTILSHELNHNRPSEGTFSAYDVPAEAIPQLIKYGVDSNRLTKFSEDGRKAFEALATQKGAEKYFSDFAAGQQAYANRTDKQTNPEEPTQTPPPGTSAAQQTGQSPENTPISTPAPEAPKIVIKSADGKKSRTFEQGKSYLIKTGEVRDGNSVWEQAEVLGANGSIVTVKLAKDGTTIDINADDVVEENEQANAIDEAMRDTEPSPSEPPPPTDEQNAEVPRPDYEQDGSTSAKKDVSEAPRTTTDPEYDSTQDFDNFHRRHSDFLWNLQSYDKNTFNQQNRDKIRTIYVNKKTAAKMGFQDNFIDDKNYKGDNEPIRVVYIVKPNDKDAFFVDKNGNPLTSINSGVVDPNRIVFSTALGDSFNFKNGKPKFTNKDGLDIENIRKKWIEKRRQLIAYDGPIANLQAMDFSVSGGIPNIGKENYNRRNSVVKSGVIDQSDLDRPVILVSTQGSITPSGVGRVSSTKDGINITSGKAKISNGISTTWLNARKILPSEANNIYDIIHYIAGTTRDPDLSKMVNYMRGVINMSSLTNRNGTVKTPLNSSIVLTGTQLYLGTDRENPIFMTRENIEANKNRIVDFLQNSYHNVDNSKLSKFDKDRQFVITKIQDGKVVTDKAYKNYNHYLLSDANGREDMPLTTNYNTSTEREGAPPFIQFYSQTDEEDSEENDNPAQSQAATPNTPPKATAPIVTPAPKETTTASTNPPVTQETGTKPLDVKTIDKALLTDLTDKTKVGEMVVSPEQSFVYGDLVTDDKGNITSITPIAVRNTKTGDIKPLQENTKIPIKNFLLNVIQTSQVTKDETNTPKSRSSKDRLSGKKAVDDGRIQYRTVFSTDLGGNSYTKIDVDAEYEKFKHIVGDKYTLNKLDHILRKTNGGFAWGAVKNAMLYVYNEAPAGTIYHEAFEAVWGNFLTGKEQQELYNEFVKREGKFQTAEGLKDFSKASLSEAKEQMGDDFAEYRLNKDRSGEITKRSPKLVQWFKNLVNFIKKIIFGRKDQINKVFDRMNQGYYRNYNNNIKNIDEAQYSTARHEQLKNLPEYMIQDTIQGMTVEMFQQLAQQSSDIVDLLEEKRGQSSKIIYDNLFTRLSRYFEGSGAGTLENEVLLEKQKLETKGAHQQDIDAIFKIYDDTVAQWDKIKGNWTGFVAEHTRFLKMFSVSFKIEDDGQVTYDEGEGEGKDDNKSSTEYAENYLTVDAKNSAASVIKLLMASVADSIWRDATASAVASATRNQIDTRRDNSSVGLPKAAQYAKLFNYILHTSANIGNIYDVVQNLYDRNNDVEARKDVDANVQRLLNKIKFTNGFKDLSYPEQRVILKLEGAIVKNKPDYDRQLMDESGSVYYKQSQLNTKTTQTVENFLAGISGSGVLKPGSDASSGVFQVTERVVNDKRGVDYLQSIGIPITKKEFRRVKGSDRDKFNKAVNGIKGTLEAAAKGNGVIQSITGRGIDFQDRLINLAEVYVNNISGDDAQAQHPNLDNQQTSSFVTNNFVITQLNGGNNAATKEQFLGQEGNGYLRDLFHNDNWLVNNVMFDEQGNHKKDVRFTIVEGLQKWDGKNTSASKLTAAIRLLFEINNNNNGTFYTLLPADSVTENAIKSGTFIDKGRFFGSQEGKEEQEKRFRDQMYQWLGTEIALAKDFKTNKDRQNIVALKDTKSKFDSTRSVGESLRFFEDILSPDIVKKINSEVIDGGKTLDSVMNRTTFDAEMLTLIDNASSKTTEFLKDWNVFIDQNDNDTYIAGVDKAFLKDTLGINDRDIYTKTEVRNLMDFREMNYIISNIDMHKVFFGDPAQYKDELKRIKSFLSGRDYTHVDMYQGTEKNDMGFNANATITRNQVGHQDAPQNRVQLKPGDPGYKVYSNKFNTATIRDVFSSSTNDREDYDEINEADAQAYIMPEAYREMMIKAAGRWTNAQERQFQQDMAWTRLEMEKDGLYTYSDQGLKKMDESLKALQDDNNVAYQPLKIIHSGVQDVNGTAVASIDKASWQMLNYKWFKNRNLGKLYVALQKKGIDYVRMESAHKVGIQSNSLTDFYDAEGNFNEKGIQGLQAEQISLKHLGIQVEQAKKEKGQTEGSQARKIITMDLLNDGVPRDYTGTPKDWNALTEAQKRKESPLYNKVKTYDDAVSNLVDIRTNGIMRKLGITPTYNDEGKLTGYDIEDKTKISKFILRELERRELPRNIAFGLEIDPETNDFKVPLEANAQYQKIRQIIYSVVESTVQRPKFKAGGQKTMVSVLGMESGARIVKKTLANGKPIYTSTELKTYEVSKDGKKTTACEVMLPYFFQKKILAAQANGATIRTREEVLKYLKTDAGKELLKGIGFRIPTQGLNSLDFFVVKDFLPENMGDSVVFPAEITTKAGSDFDIDKMNIYLKNFYIDHATGYPQVVGKGIKTNVDTNDEQALRDYYEKHLLDDYKQQEKERASNKLLGDIISKAQEAKNKDKTVASNDDYDNIESLEDEEDEIPDVDDFVRQNKGRPSGNLLTKEAAENAYVDAMEDILSENINYKALTQPNSAKQLKDLRDRIVGLTEKKEDDLIKNKPFGKLISSLFMIQERQAYLSSKSVVGIAAIANTFHSLSQGVQGSLLYWGKKDFKVRFAHNFITSEDGRNIPSLSGLSIKDYPDVYISNIISQIIDGGVDVTKDKFLAEMGINKETLPVVVGLVRLGVSARAAVTFINQPIIREYLRLDAINKSVPIGNGGLSTRAAVYNRSELPYRTKIDQRFDKPNERLLDYPPATWSITEMEQMIKADNLTADQRAKQHQILDDYIRYVQMGWDMFNFYQGYNWDTGNFGDPNMTRLKQIAYQRANIRGEWESLPMTKVNSIVTNTFLKSMRDATLSLNDAFKSIIRVQRGVAGEFIHTLAEDMSKWYGVSPRIKQQVLLRAELSTIDYSMQNDAKVSGVPLVDQMGELLLGHRSTAHYIKELKNSQVKRLVENPFVKNLVVNINGIEGEPSRVFLGDRDYDTYTSNVWTDAFRELKDDNTVIYADEYDEKGKTVGEIFNDLVKTFILEFGGRRSSNSATHLIPNDVYSQYAQSAITVMNLMNFDTVGSFYRNNMSDNNIVPPVYPDAYPLNQYGKLDFSAEPYWKHVNNSALNELMMQEKGLKVVPPLLELSDSLTKNRQFVKRIDPSDETGRRYQLLQRVNLTTVDDVEPLEVTPYRSVYKVVNRWGDGVRVQEHHQFGQPSVLTGINPGVVELSDDYIIDAITRAGIKYSASITSAVDAVNLRNQPIINAEAQLSRTSESDDDGDTSEQQTGFQPVDIEEVKRSGKKSNFDVNEYIDPNTLEKSTIGRGYKLIIPSHPDLNVYVTKDSQDDWAVLDSKTKYRLGNFSSTAKGAIEDAVNKLNDAIKRNDKEINSRLAQIGLKRYDEPDQELPKCK